MTVYGYVRVSTDKQTVENQRFEIQKFCADNNIAIDAWINETVSGTTDINKRKLGRLLSKLKEKDLLIASEISRLGRNMMQLMGILHYCLNRGVRVWTIKDGFRLGQDIQSKVLAFAFGLSAEIERNLISQRTKEALSRLKKEGKRLGRPKGVDNKKRLLSDKKQEILSLLNKGYSKAAVSRHFKVNPATLRLFLKKDVNQNNAATL